MALYPSYGQSIATGQRMWIVNIHQTPISGQPGDRIATVKVLSPSGEVLSIDAIGTPEGNG